MKKRVVLFVMALFGLTLFFLFEDAFAATITPNQIIVNDVSTPRTYSFHSGIGVDSACTFMLSGTGPQLVTISVITDKPGTSFFFRKELDYGEYRNFSYSQGRRGDAPQEQFCRGVFMPGTYTYFIGSKPTLGGSTVLYTTSVTAEAYDDSEIEPNEDPVQTLEDGILIAGSIAYNDDPEDLGDLDCYYLKLDRPCEVELSMKVYDKILGCDISRDGGGFHVFTAGDYLMPSSPIVQRNRFSLPAGTYSVNICGYADNDTHGPSIGGRYELKARIIGDPNLKISMPKSYKITKGFQYLLRTDDPSTDTLVKVDKSGFSVPLITAFRFSKSGIAQINTDMDSGSVFLSAKKKGSTTMTIGTLDGTQKIKCAISVVDNAFSRKNPITGSTKKVYTSTRRIYYDRSGNLIVELYILNKTGKTLLPGIDDLMLQITEGREIFDDFVDRTYYKYVLMKNVEWVHRKPLKNGKYTTVKYSITPNELPYDLDLCRGDYQATLDYWYGSKGISRSIKSKSIIAPLNGQEKGVKELNAPYEMVG